MENIKLPNYLQLSVLSFLMYTETHIHSQLELESFLEMISPSLRVAVVKHIFHTLITDSEVFKGQEDVINFITRKMETKIYLPEAYIIL